MNNVPPVDVDISMYDIMEPDGSVKILQMLISWLPTVLDRYVLNVFPKSLLPTAVYITTLAVLGWYLSDIIWKWLYNLTEAPQSGQSGPYKIITASTLDDKKRS
jgi:hypothetical protein